MQHLGLKDMLLLKPKCLFRKYIDLSMQLLIYDNLRLERIVRCNTCNGIDKYFKVEFNSYR